MEDDKPVTKGGNIKKPSIFLVLSWVTSAWENIPEDMVKKSFLKTGILNALDGTEDDELWDDNGNSDDDDLQVEDSLLSAWDADEVVPEEDWAKLFDDNDYSDFDRF